MMRWQAGNACTRFHEEFAVFIHIVTVYYAGACWPNLSRPFSLLMPLFWVIPSSIFGQLLEAEMSPASFHFYSLVPVLLCRCLWQSKVASPVVFFFVVFIAGARRTRTVCSGTALAVSCRVAVCRENTNNGVLWRYAASGGLLKGCPSAQ